MNQKQIGAVVIIAGIIIISIVTAAKMKEDLYINSLIKETGSCYLDDGTCLHEDRNMVLYIAGWTLSAALIILGVYLFAFDKTQKILTDQNREIAYALKHAKKNDEFKAFLSGFKEDEQKILAAVHEQDGILQSTLRYRTGMSKSTLSMLLKSLEERDIIRRKESGNTHEIYLRKKF